MGAVWQSLAVRTDASGSLLWQRVDQWRSAGSPKLGESGWQQSGSASEYVQPTSDGGYVFIQDEVGGVGILKLQTQTNTTTTAGPGLLGSPFPALPSLVAAAVSFL